MDVIYVCPSNRAGEATYVIMNVEGGKERRKTRELEEKRTAMLHAGSMHPRGKGARVRRKTGFII